MSLVFWQYRFRKYSTHLLVYQMGIGFFVCFIHTVQIFEKQRERIALTKLFYQQTETTTHWKNNRTSKILEWMHNRIERGDSYSGLPTRCWKMRDHTNQFIEEWELFQGSDFTLNMRETVDCYYNDMVLLQKTPYRMTKEQIRWFQETTAIDTLLKNRNDYEILEYNYRSSKNRSAQLAYIEKCKSDIRTVENAMIQFAALNTSVFCGYTSYTPRVKGNRQLLKDKHLQLKIGLENPILNQFHQPVIGGDTITVDKSYKTPIHKFKPQCIGNHT